MRKNWLAKQMIGGNCGSLLLLATEALINKSCQRGDFTHASGTTKVKRNKKNGCAIWMAFEMKWWYFQPAYGWMVSPGQPCWSPPLHWICQNDCFWLFYLPNPKSKICLFKKKKSNKRCNMFVSPVPRLTLTLGSTKRLATIWLTLSVF